MTPQEWDTVIQVKQIQRLRNSPKVYEKLSNYKCNDLEEYFYDPKYTTLINLIMEQDDLILPIVQPELKSIYLEPVGTRKKKDQYKHPRNCKE